MNIRATTCILLISLAAISGCKSKQSISETRQQEITRLQNQWNSLLATYIADCPSDPKTLESPHTPKCLGELQKSHNIEQKLKTLTEQQAAE